MSLKVEKKKERSSWLRRGTFAIHIDLLRNSNSMISILFSKIIVMRAEYMAYSDCIEYLGHSWLFDELKFGDEAPRYYLKIDSDFRISAMRIEE